MKTYASNKMPKKISAKFIFVNISKKDGIETYIEIDKLVKCSEYSMSSYNYFNNLNRNVKLQKTLRTKQHNTFDSFGRLRYVILNGVRYVVENVREIEQRDCFVDLKEMK